MKDVLIFSMRNSLSQILAEITTSYFIKNAMSKFSNGEVSFLFKYVDIWSAIDSEYVDKVQEAITSEHQSLSLKILRENLKHELNYLNLTVGRHRYPEDNDLVHLKWWQKECSSKHILDFHSFHPDDMKKNVIQEYVNVALNISSVQHWKEVFFFKYSSIAAKEQLP